MSEPRKSRREAKPTQRLKEFLGEETAKSSTPKAAKLLSKTAATPRASAKNEKLASTKSSPDKASLAKKGIAKPTAISKVVPAKAQTPAAKAVRNVLSREEDSKISPSTPTASRMNVTQSVKKTSIKEAKKAVPATKTLVDKKPEILRTKRVPKPSAKVAEAMEAEAEAEQIVRKPVLTPASKAAKPAPFKTVTSSAGRGGRGRGASGLKDRGRGRGRGRGRPLLQARFAEDEDDLDVSAEKELDDDDDDDDDLDDMEDELMDVDEGGGGEEVEEELEEEEEEEDDDEIDEEEEEEEEDEEPPMNIVNKFKKGQAKPDSVVKKLVTHSEKNSGSGPANKGNNESPVQSAVTVSLTGAALNPIVKRVVSSASSPVKVTPQAPRKDSDSSSSPAKSCTVKQVGRGSGGGVKRILTAASPPTSPLAKKVKLSSDESANTGSSVADISSPANAPSKPVFAKTQPVAVVTSSSSVAAANGVRQKVATVKTVAKTIPASAKLQPKPVVNKIASGMNDAENRRSRRQPKPTERMKEFLHKSSEEEEEEEEGDEDDPSALLDDNDMDSEEDMDEYDDDDEESSQRFLEFMNKAAGRQKNQRFESTKSSKLSAGGVKVSPQKFIKTQLIRKGSQSGPEGRGPVTAVMMQSKAGNATSGASKTPKVVQVQTTKFTPGSKVMVQPPTSVNGDVRKGTASGLLSSVGGLRAVASEALKKTEPRRVPGAPPVVIKIRTRKPEEDEILRKKKDEEDKQAGTRKIIKIYTRLGAGRKIINKGGGSKSSIDPESESMESDEDESEREDSTEPKACKPLSGKNEKLIRLCEEAVESLKHGLKSHKKEPSQSINSKTIEKFIRLSSEITETVKETIDELGGKISNSDNFEEYCQDVLDSISFKYNEDISHEEADSLLSWLRKQDKESQRDEEARSSEKSSQLVLYSQMLELLTSVNDEGNEGTFDEEEEMDEEDEEMMDMDDEATYDKEYYGEGGDDGEEMDEDEAQEEEDEEDYLGEEEEEEEEEAADDPSPAAVSKSAGRR
ncbi:hypothetical protein FHG87_011664 [Trinorchestia longiramus]|nr:hypothetical protein FHG87_011664 [Trinorchestia longiramus]